MSKAIRDTPKPSTDGANDEVELPEQTITEQGLSLSQHNYAFNVLVGIDPAQVEDMILEGRTMLSKQNYKWHKLSR